MTGSEINYDLLRPMVPFKDLLPSHLQQLLDESETLYLFPGDVLCEKGQYDEVHYYLLYGELLATNGDPGNAAVEAGDYRESSLYPVASCQPRPCRVQAKTEVRVLQVNRERLDQLLAWSQAAEYLLVDFAQQRALDEDAAWLGTILKSNLFLKVPPTNVDQMFRHLQTRLVSADQVIVRQGELGDCCYFIKEGEAEVVQYSDSDPRPRSVARISAGRCFGEDALLRETVRNATVRMLTDGVLLSLAKTHFLQLLREPPVEQISWNGFLKQATSTTIVDVRTEAEYAQGHLRNAVNIPLNLLRLKGRMLTAAGSDKHQCVVYCNSGRRSATASYFLAKQGLSAVSLAGGIGQLEQEQCTPLWSTTDYVLHNGQVVEGH
ncbi:MAG: cyclic nucleotide-binding domain-containing protein [Gammaproteobacteria bacterium]|nr:cyclic nucleotide-binding domain-containing protein [Gammaproteobacteria bacterium]